VQNFCETPTAFSEKCRTFPEYPLLSVIRYLALTTLQREVEDEWELPVREHHRCRANDSERIKRRRKRWRTDICTALFESAVSSAMV
jgi:hypothetical protein